MSGIPKPNSPRFLERIREILEVAIGDRGNILDRFVTVKDLVNSGLADYVHKGVRYSKSEASAVQANTVADLTVPPAPTNLSANAAVMAILVAFDNPHNKYGNHSHTEIWRASVDDLAQAYLRGSAPGGLYADEIGDSGIQYYYWARSVSTSNITGPFNAINGTPATAAQILGANVAAGTLTADKLQVANLAAISADLGSITAGSLNINNKFLVDNQGNATIRSAATGARLEIFNNVIRVYDASGVLRVELGQLSA